MGGGGGGKGYVSPPLKLLGGGAAAPGPHLLFLRLCLPIGIGSDSVTQHLLMDRDIRVAPGNIQMKSKVLKKCL